DLYREVVTDGSKREIVFDEGGSTSLAEIPVAVVYSRRTGWLRSQPPLLDMALINICHFQKYNDFSIYMHIASRPILCRKGADSSKPVTQVSAYTIMDVAPEGNVWFAETTGAALAAASEDIKELESRMSILGLSLLVKRTGAQVTATEERQDQIEESSDL